MRLNSLHNALFVAARLLRAELIAVKLLPADHVDWTPADIAVGDTSQLQQFAWQDGAQTPDPKNCLRRHQPLFGVPDALSVFTRPDAGSIAVAITINETVLNALPGQFLLHERRGTSRLALGEIWFALTLEEHSPHAELLLDPQGPSELIELIFGVCSQALWGMYRSAMLQIDPTTKLPGATELRHRLQLNLAKVRAAQKEPDLHQAETAKTVLMLLQVDNFTLLRRQLGTTQTDMMLAQLAQRLEQAVRKNDGLFRFSESVFAITADVAEGSATQVIRKVVDAWQQLARDDRYKGITSSLGYSIVGYEDAVASSDTQSLPDARQLLLRVEQALLHAQETGGNQAIEASAEFSLDDMSHGQPTGGVFTSDPMKDYRNSRILWYTTSLIAAESNPNVLCRSFIELLQDMLGLIQADVFCDVDGELYSQSQSSNKPLAGDYVQLVKRCLGTRSTQRRSEDTGVSNPADAHFESTSLPGTELRSEPSSVAVPLISRDQVVGALLIESDERFDDTDLVFLKAIADQIAGALDRLELAQRQAILNAREQSHLRAEIRELKEQSNLPDATPVVAASAAMRDVLAYIEKIAPTDASVLIMGESGAGKEVMAKAIVAASKRADAPLITVDCSAIAHSLIDSELFGRVKGAFTGADDASPGRIAEAHGGTLFLDEIGELPMDVQAKLLRFVQEKELIAVGDTRRRRIDTRIICATNRDLLLESSQGRFRSDLYYRLQVLQVTVPPLRERQDDIPGLASAFINRYSAQFGKAIDGFTDSAWEKIQSYDWPGNIRELQNAIVRATLTTDSNVIDAPDLQFGVELPTPEPSVFTGQQQPDSHNDHFRQPLRAPAHSQAPFIPTHHDTAGHPHSAERHENTTPQSNASGDDWETLTSLLAGQVSALVAESRLEAPVGRWLADTVVLTAAKVSDGVARQAARLLGVPETTLRRQLNKARQNEDNPFQLMSKQWLTSLPALTDLLQNLMHQSGEDTEFAERCQVLLLQQVANHIGNDRKAGAALMGITPPTYARWIERHRIEVQPVDEPTEKTTFKLEQKFS